MTARDPIDSDLDDARCTVAACLSGARHIGVATVAIPATLGFTDDESTVVLELPLCFDHAYRVRGGVTSCDLDSRLS